MPYVPDPNEVARWAAHRALLMLIIGIVMGWLLHYYVGAW